jgi:hypothetical protein
MPFGKFAGRRISDIPSGYLVWCVENLDGLNWAMREAIEEELLLRHDEEEPVEEAAVACDGVVSRWYREMVLRFHPDRGGQHGGGAGDHPRARPAAADARARRGDLGVKGE